MNISYETKNSMEKFHNNENVQELVSLCLDNYHTKIFDDIVGAISSRNKGQAIVFLEELENYYIGTSNFHLFSVYKSIILTLFDDSRIKNLKGAFLEVLAFKILENQYLPHTSYTDCNVWIDGWGSELTVDIAMECGLSGLCCECKVPTSKFTWQIFKNLLDIRSYSNNYFNVFAITLEYKERMDMKKQRIKCAVPEAIGCIDEVNCITRENLGNFNI